MLRVALQISKDASSIVTSRFQTDMLRSKNRDPYDLSFLDSPDLSEPRKEALYRMTLKEIFTTPFPVCFDTAEDNRDKAEAKQEEPEEDLFDERHDDDMRIFLQTFKVHEKTAQIARLLEDHPDTLKRQFVEFVPLHVSYNEFWQRFFYRCDEARIERLWEAERRRKQEGWKESLALLRLPFEVIYNQSSKSLFFRSDFERIAGDVKSDTPEIVTHGNDNSTMSGSIIGDVKNDASVVMFKEAEPSASDDSQRWLAPSKVQKEAIKLMSMKEIYTTPLLHDEDAAEKEGIEIDEEEQDEVRHFLDSFDLVSKTEDIVALLEKHADTVKVHYYELVPRSVSYVDFWQRFFFRCDEKRVENGLASRDELTRKAQARALGAVKSMIVAPADKSLLILEANKTEATEMLTIFDNNKKSLENCKKKLERSKLQIAILDSRFKEAEARLARTKKRVAESKAGLRQAQKKLEANEAKEDEHQPDVELEANSESKEQLVQPDSASSAVATNEAKEEELQDAAAEFEAKKEELPEPDLDSSVSSLSTSDDGDDGQLGVASPISVMAMLKVDWCAMAKYRIGEFWPKKE